MSGEHAYALVAFVVWPVVSLVVGYRARTDFGTSLVIGAVLAGLWPFVLVLAYLVRPSRGSARR